MAVDFASRVGGVVESPRAQIEPKHDVRCLWGLHSKHFGIKEAAGEEMFFLKIGAKSSNRVRSDHGGFLVATIKSMMTVTEPEAVACVRANKLASERACV